MTKTGFPRGSLELRVQIRLDGESGVKEVGRSVASEGVSMTHRSPQQVLGHGKHWHS